MREYVRAFVIIYRNFVSTISYKSLLGILPNLQLRCSWAQR